MLRVAVPNKGSLNGPAVQLLSDAGYRVHRDNKALFATDAANDVQFVFLRPTDIARTVGTGVLDVGITGQDLLRAAGTDTTTQELLPLDFGVSRFYFAAPAGRLDDLKDLDGKRVATSFGALVTAAAADLGIDVQVIELDGAVETAVDLGLADAIADVVETGASGGVTGILAGGGDDLLVLRHLTGEADPPPRSRVVTSGLGGVFPKGIVVGMLLGIRADAEGLTREGDVQPGVDFAELEDVFIRRGK